MAIRSTFPQNYTGFGIGEWITERPRPQVRHIINSSVSLNVTDVYLRRRCYPTRFTPEKVTVSK